MRTLLLSLLFFSCSYASENPLLQKIAVAKGTERIRLMNDYINDVYLDSSDRALPLAIENLKEAARTSSGSNLHYKTISTLASIYQDLGLYDSVEAVAGRGLKLAKQNRSLTGQGYFLTSFANIYRLKGNYDKAIANYLESIRIAESNKDTSLLTFLYNGIGITYFDLQDYPKSLQYLRQGLYLSKVVKSESRLTEYYLNLGSSFSESGMQDSAIHYWTLCNKLAEKNNYHDMLSASFNNLAGSYFALGQYEKTLEYGLKSLALAEKFHDRQSMVLYTVNIGALYAELKQFDKAMEFLKRGLKLSEELGYKKLIGDAYLACSNVYELQGNFKLSLDYHKKYLALKDTLFSDERSKTVSELNAKYETEKKQRHIEVLSKESALQRSEVSRQKLFRNSMFGVSLLLGGLGLVVFRGYKEKKKANGLLTIQKEEIELQREMLAHRNKDITDSIQYGQRIQKALLPSVKQVLPFEHFLLFKPRDIVSGDFYWAGETNGKTIIAVADCTGHGVPGAFMSMIGISHLNELVKVKGIDDPSVILNSLRDKIIESLSAEGSVLQDGMDISLVAIDHKAGKLAFSGANNPGYIIRLSNEEPEIITLPADKMPVGKYSGAEQKFSVFNFEFSKGDQLYLTTDGFADQFGGPMGKKFRIKQLKELLLQVSSESLHRQGELIETELVNWKGHLEQVDDVCVLGIKF